MGGAVAEKNVDRQFGHFLYLRHARLRSIHVVSFERLVDQPLDTLRSVFEYLGVDPAGYDGSAAPSKVIADNEPRKLVRTKPAEEQPAEDCKRQLDCLARQINRAVGQELYQEAGKRSALDAARGMALIEPKRLRVAKDMIRETLLIHALRRSFLEGPAPTS